MTAFTTFETAIGECALAWSGDCVTRVLLPGGAGEDMADRCRHSAAPAGVEVATNPDG
jgi:hypothetical protein